MSTQPFDTLTSVVHSWVRLKDGSTGEVVSQTEGGEVGVSLPSRSEVVFVPLGEVVLVPSLPTPTSKASQAAAKHYAGDPDGWQHLMAICWTAVDPLRAPVPFVWIKGAAKAATARFIEEFLAEELGRHTTAAAQQAAVSLDVFRYLGKHCRQRLIDRIRKYNSDLKAGRDLFAVSDEPHPRAVSIGRGNGNHYTNWWANPKRSVVQRDELHTFLDAEKSNLIQENGEEWYRKVRFLAELYPTIESGDAVRALATACGVSDRQARNLAERYARRALANLLNSGSATRRLYHLLDVSEKDTRPSFAHDRSKGRRVPPKRVDQD